MTVPQPPPRTATTVATGTFSGVCHGTLGELFQGPVTHCARTGIGVVSFPVDRYSWVHFTPGEDDSQPLPALPKAARSIRRFLHRYGLELPAGRWSSHSELEVGVGMASSTADIVATLRCLFRIFALPYDSATVIDILSGIERADSVFLDEFALYLSDRHEVVHRLGSDIGFHTCYVTEPGTVDTASVTPLLLRHYHRYRAGYEACLNELVAAFAAGDAKRVAEASTMSAALSQEVLPKLTYDEVAAQRRDFGAAGLFVAHTGALLGYLFTTRLSRTRMDELSAFFHGLGLQCSFAWGGYGGLPPTEHGR